MEKKRKKKISLEVIIGVIILIIAVSICLLVIKKAYDRGDNRRVYIACGCGCCDEDYEERCLYYSQGDSIEEIIQADIEISENPSCEILGCSKGIKYSYCD